MKRDEAKKPMANELQIKAEQLKFLFAPAIPVAIAHNVAGLIILSFLWDQTQVAHAELFAFLAVIFVVSVARLLQYIAYKKAPQSLSQVRDWEKQFFIGSIAIGLVWCLSQIWFFPRLDAPHQLMMVIVIGGVAALGSISFSPLRKAYIVFIPIVLLPVTGMLLFESYQNASGISVLLMFLLLGLFGGAERNYRNIVQNISLRIESQEREEAIRLSKEKLRESEERFSLAMKGANDGLWDWNLETDEVYYSPRWKEMLGYKEDELGSTLDVWSGLVHPDDKDRALEKVQEYVEGRAGSFEVEMRMRHKQGHWVIVLSRAFLVRRSSDHKAIRLTGTHVDITERKKLEEEKQSQIHHLESMQKIADAVSSSLMFDGMLNSVIKATREIFESDRAWLLYPCDPEADYFEVPVESNLPEYPGAFALKQKIPVTSEIKQVFEDALGSKVALVYCPVSLGDITDQFTLRSQLVMAIKPQFGKPWLLGLHQCSHERAWTVAEQRLCNDIGSRITDVLSAAHLERELGRSEKYFRSIIENTSDIITIIKADGTVTYESPSVERVLGYKPDELLGEIAFDYVHPDDQQVMMAKLRECLQTSGAVVSAEFRGRHKDGSWRALETIGNNLLHDPNVQGIVVTSRDITERKLVEEKLRTLSQSVEQAGESVLITDKQGIIEYVNPAFTEITGYTSEEVVGKNPSILKSDAQDASCYKSLWETLTRGEVWHGTLIDRKKDGSFFPALLSVSPIHDERGEITHYVGIQQDMTEHEQLEQQLQQAQKMEAIGTLVGGIAHDFNNMLASIMGVTYLAKLKIEDKAIVMNKLEVIETLSIRAADMVSQLLTFARKDSIKMSVFSLTPFLNEALKLARSGIPENIKLCYQTCPDNLMIHGDMTQLQQMIMNLLNNARDALTGVSNPVIDCVLEIYPATNAFRKKHSDLQGDRFAHLTIRDNGCGIPEAQLSQIFDPFFTTKPVGEGTGLGLSMAFGSIQRHGGVVEVESEVGKGTAFHLYLPLQEKVEKDEVEEAVAAVKSRGETILLVDDDENVRRTACEVLRSLGYKVLEASDGRQAIEVYSAKQDSIDLLIIDVVMPEMGGVEAVRKIREINPALPVIFATGYDKQAALEKEGTLANSMVLSKPFRVEKLSQNVRTMFESTK